MKSSSYLSIFPLIPFGINDQADLINDVDFYGWWEQIQFSNNASWIFIGKWLKIPPIPYHGTSFFGEKT